MYMYQKGRGRKISLCRCTGRTFYGALPYPYIPYLQSIPRRESPTVVKSRRAMMASVVGEAEGPALVNVAPL